MDPSANLYTGWDHYRLADMLRLPQLRYGPCTVPSLPYPNEASRYLDQFPDSIASSYIRSLGAYTHKPGVHLPFLHHSVVKHPYKPYPSNDIYLHLRIGDVCLADNDVRFKRKMTPRELCIHGLELQYGPHETRFYIQPWNHYAQHLMRCKKLGARPNVILVAGIHRDGKGTEESHTLLRLYTRHLEKLGLRVSHRIGKNPDEDFILLSSAPFFIPGGGGYAQLIQDYRDYTHTMG